MNFAEAALLIQGSACIYSKKFLSLDDINGTNKSNMDMRKNNSPNVVDIVPLTPMGLVPPEEAEKKDNPLYSRKGEILASCKDFRVNTYTPHANGAFVLDLAGMSPTREFLREGNNRNASVLDVGPGDENGNLQAGTSNNEAPLPILNFSDLGGSGDNDCDDNDAGDAFPPLAEGNGMEVDPSPSEHVERHQAVNDRYMLRERALAPAETEKPKGILFSNEIAAHQNKDLENAEEQNEVEDNCHDDYLDNDGGDDFSDHENLAQDFPAEILDEEGLAATEPQEERPSYEDLVRRNVDLFIANSQKYARETVLSIRVRDWEDKMGPQLTEQEERVAFDIHDYGDKIVDAFSQVGERRTFASIVKGKEAFEVCRYKLASLQLANDCTVKIDKKPGLYESIDSMELTLLSKRRAHERFQTYAAPSLTDF
ncbi:UNVERIFIED_CONTAM: hypothetical protein FKN15_030258 [Acipenser sinensis]